MSALSDALMVRGWDDTLRRHVRRYVGDAWFQDGAAAHGSRSSARKLASAMIAKIPFDLAHHVAQTYFPRKEVA